MTTVLFGKEYPDLPDRLSIDKDSPFYNKEVLDHKVGVMFKGVPKDNVAEYCVSEGWVRVIPQGNMVDRKGKRVTVKLQGLVKPYYRTSQ